MRFRYTCNSNSKLLIRRMDERGQKRWENAASGSSYKVML
jgi:hypothetical protein